MKASVQWIKQLLPALKATPAAIAKRLTQAGVEVEASHSQSGALANIVVAEVTSARAHPEAAALKIVEVFDGESSRVVVCGASNVAEGQKVALARTGAVLPGGMKIERRKLRGVESDGMICSSVELGLSDAAEGILVLNSRMRPGKPIAEALDLQDVILEISATPNRPDVLSHIGLARELAAIHGLPIPEVSVRLREGKEASSDRVRIEIRDGKRCPMYVGRVITGVRVGPSPDEVVRRLRAVGLRSISNVVDATNLALFELGHPLHAFDLDKLRGSKIIVRAADEGEKLGTIDGTLRVLSGDDLVIADGEGPVALAGVMGGAESGVSEGTVDILLEAAIFDPKSIRRTAKRHALHTEASHRFERGADPEMVEVAIDRCAELIVDLAGGAIARGRVAIEKDIPKPPLIPLRPARATAVIGRPIDRKEAKQALSALGLEPVSAKSGEVERARAAIPKPARALFKDALFFQVPSWRVDLKREEDLIEEIARLGGYDAIPTVMPPSSSRIWSGAPSPDPERRVRELLAGHGFLEAVSLAFNSRQQLGDLGIEDGGYVEVQNPLGEESALMRVSLLPALLRAARFNQDVVPSMTDLRLFEIGKTFVWGRPAGRLPIEKRRVAVLMRGHRQPPRWCAKDEKGRVALLDAYDLRGVVEAILGSFRIEGARFVADEKRWLHPRSATRIDVGEITLGSMGELHPDAMVKSGLEGGPVFVADLALDAIDEAAGGFSAFHPLPKQPPARRDLSFFIAREVPAERVLEAVRDAGRGANLEAVDVFDVYEGAGLPEGKRSLAIAMTFRALDRTLTDAEVERAQAGIISALTELGAEIRMA